MSTKLVLGMAGLGICLAVAGGVGGFFIHDTINNQIPTTSQVEENTETFDATDYNLPEDLYYTSYTIYDISDKYSLFSSSSVGCYLLNKETKEFTFFNSSSVSSCSDNINDNVYLWMTNYTLFKFNIETGNHEVISLSSEVVLTSMSFIGSCDGNLFIKGSSNATSSYKYYFAIYNTISGECEIVEITSTQYSYSNYCYDLGNYYFLTRTYSSSSSTTTISSYLYNKESKEMITIQSYYLLNENSFVVRDDKMYAVMRYGTSTSICSVNLTDGAVTVLQSSVTTAGQVFELSKGFVYSYQMSVNASSYTLVYAYYVSFEDDSVVTVGYEDSDATYMLTYNIEGQLLFSPRTDSSSNRYGKLAIFNEDTKYLETIYTSLVTSTSGSHCFIYEFNGEYFVSTDSTNFAKMTVSDNGEISFTDLTLSTNPTKTSYEIGNGKYIFEDSGLKYYDFENDIYKSLKSTSCTIVDISIEGNIVTIYTSDNVKYEFNLDTLAFKAVAYWE